MNVVHLNFIQGIFKWNNGKNNCREELHQSIGGKGIVHHTQPSSVSITQVCETGEVYQLDEIKKIAEITHKHNLNLHMDGLDLLMHWYL